MCSIQIYDEVATTNGVALSVSTRRISTCMGKDEMSHLRSVNGILLFVKYTTIPNHFVEINYYYVYIRNIHTFITASRMKTSSGGLAARVDSSHSNECAGVRSTIGDNAISEQKQA